MSDASVLGLFAGYGIELEYMLVDRDTLAVAPICDEVLQAAAGEPTSEHDTGEIGWSNELALHVIEVKTNGPVAEVTAELADRFVADLRRIDAIARERRVRLLPTAMHPTMDPARDTKLWPHDGRPIYAAYDRAFSCSGHGWGNLQSCHLNLPFAGPEEFGRLHAAIRPVLALLPALAASSPIVDGQVTGHVDTRLRVYAENQRRVPSIIGDVIPEPVFTPQAYHDEILAPMYRDVAPLDPEGVLQHEWLNSRGAIARFERDAIEIRVLDVQETPLADLAIVTLASAAIRALAEERFVAAADVRALSTSSLRAIFDRAVTDGDEALVDDEPLLRALGCDEHRVRAGELWTLLLENLRLPQVGPGTRLQSALRTILGRGPLARRILRATGPRPSPARIREVWMRLSECLLDGRLFTAE